MKLIKKTYCFISSLKDLHVAPKLQLEEKILLHKKHSSDAIAYKNKSL